MMISNLTVFAISNLIIAFIHFPLFLILLIKGKTKASKIYSLHILCIVFWGIGAFFATTASEVHIADISWRITYSFVLLIPVFFFHTILTSINKDNKVILFLSYAQALFFIVLTLKGKLWFNLYKPFDTFYFFKGNLYYTASFIIWFLIVSLAYAHLFLYFKPRTINERMEMLCFISALPFGFLGAMSNFITGFGLPIYPSGNFILPFYTFTTIWAILKHQSFQVHILIKKSVVYSLLVLMISLLYLILVFLSERYIQNIWGYKSLFFSVVIAFALGTLFFPLRNKIQEIIDRFILHKTQEEMIKENDLLLREVLQTEKMRSVAVLASGVAHEIKNPLATIKTFFEYLPDKKNDPEFLNKLNRIVGIEISRVDQLVHQLLEFAKPSPAIFAKTNVHRLISDMLDFIAPHLNKNNIDLTKSFSPENSLFIETDSNKLKQALLNIFFNAIDAMPNGGQLTVSSTVSNDTLVISIEDTGCGIDPKDLPHIFEPFYSKKEKGTGLGLAITKNIIEEHKGSITAESKSGQGTKFILKLPIKSG